ncbi:hypothetical protein G7054_g1608 [Neopestalotiopsis clavispora]|nr:hypothetical protein G7054_g1608 [Neopestalotiopsis clavispora]
MHFRSVLPLLGLTASASAVMSASQVTANIDAVTQMSSDTNNIAQSISLTNLFSTTPDCLDVTDVEKCLADVGEIVEDPGEILGTKRSVKASKKTRRQFTSFSDVEQQAICASFKDFVTIHQQLLNIVIGKHGLLSQTPFTAPMAAVLRTLEGAVDTLAFGVIDLVPTCAQGATQNLNSLDTTLNDAITTYQ